MSMPTKDSVKWEGKTIAKLSKCRADEVWPLLEDFCSLNKWLPTIDTCYLIEGPEPAGLIRYCASSVPPAEDGGEMVVRWCQEKLVAVDPIKKCVRYEILENNMGIKGYESTMEVVPMDNMGGGGGGGDGCSIEWSFLADPIEGTSLEDMLAYLGSSLQGMAHNIEEALETNRLQN